jgi:hypothetical protein
MTNSGQFRISTEVSYARADLEQRAGYSFVTTTMHK